MQIKYKNKAELESLESISKVTDYPVGTIVQYTALHYDGEAYYESADHYIGIVLETAEGNCVLYDVEDSRIYDDVENYTVVKVCDGYLAIRRD